MCNSVIASVCMCVNQSGALKNSPDRFIGIFFYTLECSTDYGGPEGQNTTFQKTYLSQNAFPIRQQCLVTNTSPFPEMCFLMDSSTQLRSIFTKVLHLCTYLCTLPLMPLPAPVDS